MLADLDFTNNEKGEQLIEAVLSEVLRNSGATLAIAAHLGIQVEHLVEHSEALEDKIEGVQEDLAEVEDVLSASETAELAEGRQDPEAEETQRLPFSNGVLRCRCTAIDAASVAGEPTAKPRS
jgi:hypothetical protein